MALACHHVVLPNISVHPRAMEWEIFGISPTDQTNLAMDMPSRLDNLETVALLKEEINAIDTATYKTIKTRLQDPQDFLIPMERMTHELAERVITTKEANLRKAEEFLKFKANLLSYCFVRSSYLRLEDIALFPRHINMANLIYSLFPTENLVVDPAPKHKRVGFSPLEIQQAVEAGDVLANLRRKFCWKFSDYYHNHDYHNHNHVTRHINMANLNYSLLPTETLVVDPAPKYKRVEFSPYQYGKPHLLSFPN